MTRRLAKMGDKTTQGYIISASSSIFDEMKALVRTGDKAWSMRVKAVLKSPELTPAGLTNICWSETATALSADVKIIRYLQPRDTWENEVLLPGLPQLRSLKDHQSNTRKLLKNRPLKP